MFDLKRAVALVCVFALQAAPLAAQQQARNAAPSRNSVVSKRSSEQPAAARDSKEDRKSNEEVMAAIEQLKVLVQQQSEQIEAQNQTIRQQQQKMEALERQVQQQGTSTAIAAESAKATEEKVNEMELIQGQLEAVADSANETAGRVTKLQTDITTQNRSNDGKFRQLGNFRFNGDLRFRYEPFVQSEQTTRQRVRVRARLNVLGNISDEISGGLSFATGSNDDPISTNQTLSGFFNRKFVGFDRYFINYTPNWLNKHGTIGFGKFAYPWIRTTLTFDSDLNPEGIYTRGNWDFKDAGPFRGLTLVSMWLPILERGGSTSSTTGVRADGYDAFATGGQLQTRWQFGRVNAGLHAAVINFINSDFIAQAHSTSAIANQNQLTGNQPITNTLRTNATGQTVGYASKFMYLDVIAQLGISTGVPRWPVNITLDFNNNMRATRIVQSGTAAPTGQISNPERSAYYAEITFGRLSEVKDVQFGYTLYRIERDAVITAFNESDLRAGSNVLQNRFNVSYQWLPNLQFSYSLWLGSLANAQDNIGLVPGGKRAVVGGPCNSTANPTLAGCSDNFLKRQQFDFIYRF